MRALRKRVSSAHVISLIALFVAISGTTFAAVTVTSREVVNNSLKTKDLKDGKAVTGADVVDGSLGGTDVVDGSILTEDLADGAVTGGKIADAQVGSVDLSDQSVTTDKLADAAVTAGKLADTAVTVAKIADSAVTGAKIADSAVTVAKIADSAVTGAKIANGTVGATDLASDAVTAPKLAAITARPTDDIDVPAGESRAGTASCDAGEVAISGGIHFDTANNADTDFGVLHSYRSTQTSWLVRAFNNSGAQQTFQAYAFCLGD